ncbi:hypothetical protein M514_23862 [Trichuris suis]|uniref:Uncharacterized protein n=1 Tax=Trichuris suis TaxID=68888 RepID=A0A085N325_9BILA|nr:hypothetical protein M514_23862 [Trichuris suis]
MFTLEMKIVSLCHAKFDQVNYMSRSDNPRDVSADCTCCTSDTGDYRPERVSWFVDFRMTTAFPCPCDDDVVVLLEIFEYLHFHKAEALLWRAFGSG